jgi:hypothetical protein
VRDRSIFTAPPSGELAGLAAYVQQKIGQKARHHKPIREAGTASRPTCMELERQGHTLAQFDDEAPNYTFETLLTNPNPREQFGVCLITASNHDEVSFRVMLPNMNEASELLALCRVEKVFPETKAVIWEAVHPKRFTAGYKKSLRIVSGNTAKHINAFDLNCTSSWGPTPEPFRPGEWMLIWDFNGNDRSVLPTNIYQDLQVQLLARYKQLESAGEEIPTVPVLHAEPRLTTTTPIPAASTKKRPRGGGRGGCVGGGPTKRCR